MYAGGAFSYFKEDIIMMQEVPLTAEQRDFATEHHNLVYSFLNENQLSEDDYYDVVIFGYLNAVKDYFSRSNLQKYAFSTIAWRYMYRKLSNDYKRQSCPKRNASVLSIHVSSYENVYALENKLAAPDTLMEDLEADLLLHELAGRVSKEQMRIVRMKSDGYSVRDIARRQQTTTKRVQELLEEIRTVLLEVCRT